MTADQCKVLVVDDDRVNRIMLSTLLEHQGHRATAATDGLEALALLAGADFDVVLLDIVMPGMDGIEVLQTLKRDSARWDIPVIMISSVEETASIAQCIELGAEDYLPKPCDPVLLRARLNASTARKRLRDTEAEYHDVVLEQRAELAALNRRLSRRMWGRVAELENLGRLRRFLSPAHAEQLASAEANLGPHGRHIAVLACAVGGVHGLAERATPHQAMDIVERFHATVGELADRFEATVGSTTVDGVTLYFNDPLPCAEPAARAARMAAALQDELSAGLARAGERHGCRLTFGAAVAVGEALLGEVGHEARSAYVAIGAVFERVGRLLTQAVAEGTVLVDDEAQRESATVPAM